jgi:hypothetical protein
LSTDLTNKEQVEDLIRQIENALRALRIERKQFVLAAGVTEELEVALANARTALSMAGGEHGDYESAKLRLGWVAARLKRANERVNLK